MSLMTNRRNDSIPLQLCCWNVTLGFHDTRKQPGLTAPWGGSPQTVALHYSKEILRNAPMTTATLTSKGQITIPVDVREALGVDAGDRVEFVEIAPGRYEFIAATKSVTALKGMFGKPRKSVSIEEMNAAIARRGAAAK